MEKLTTQEVTAALERIYHELRYDENGGYEQHGLSIQGEAVYRMCLKRLSRLYERMKYGIGDDCIPTDFNNMKNGIANLLHNCPIPEKSPYNGSLFTRLAQGMERLKSKSHPAPVPFDTLHLYRQSDFAAMVMEGTTAFVKATFEECEFRGSLRQFDFSDCRMVDCVFTDCDLTGTRFYNAVLSGCEFQTTNLAEVNFRYGDIYYNRFRNCKLNLADFQQSSLRHNRFLDCSFDRASFVAATLDSTEFDRTVSAKGIYYPDTMNITMGGATDLEVYSYRQRVFRGLSIGSDVQKPPRPKQRER